MFSYNGGCLPPQLPPPLPLPHYYHHPVMQPPQWMPQYPAPNMYPVPPPPQQLPPVPPHFLPHPPPYTTNFTPGRGRGRGGRQAFNSRNKPTWNVQKCDPCNKVYKTEETFAEHLQSHVKCTQCDFTALPKKVKEHSQVHSLPDFLSFKSVDDVKRWRDERKRNYPTALNVEKKIKNEDQKRLRGQTIDTPLYRYVNQLIGDYDSRCRGRGGRRSNNRGRWNTQRRHNQSGYRKEQTTVSDADTITTPVPTANNDSPNDVVTTCPSTINNQEPTKTNRRNREMKRQRHPEKGNGPVKKHQHCDWTALSVPSNPSLLEKLLASNVRSEHNAILQCVRYTVRNNFFQTIAASNKNNDCCSNSTNSTVSTTDDCCTPTSNSTISTDELILPEL